jgi:hypothetical protein
MTDVERKRRQRAKEAEERAELKPAEEIISGIDKIIIDAKKLADHSEELLKKTKRMLG